MAEGRDRHVNTYICLSITFSAAIITLAFRLVARRLMKVRLWYDDYLIIVAFLFAVCWNGFVIWWLSKGLGFHLDQIHAHLDETLRCARLILYHVELFYTFSLGFAKFAILAFYWRMFSTSNIKIPIQVLGGCAMIWLIVRTILTIFHCVPIHKFWDVATQGVCNINDSTLFFGTVLTHLIIDIGILALPVLQVQKLQLPLAQRLGIMAMFMFGIFVCIASIVVLVYSAQYDTASNEIMYNIAPIIKWATIEVNLAIVSACLPMLRPIYLIVVRRPLSKNASSVTYGPSSHPSYSSKNKLNALTSSKEVTDEADSTRELAPGMRRERSNSSETDYSGHGGSQNNKHGNTTVIVGPADADTESRPGSRRGSIRPESGMRECGWNSMGRIVVTNEMSIRVSKIT